MNQSASRPRLTRGAHDPKAFAYNIVGLFSQILPLLAYLGRTLNDTMCDHTDPDICDRCQRKLYTLGTLISGSASAVASWAPARLAELNARLAIAAARRLADTIELGHPLAWAMKGGAVLTAARRAINAATALLDVPELGAMNEANTAARSCQELDLSTSRVARKRGLAEESQVIGYVLKAASKAAEAAVHASESRWAARPGATAGREDETARHTLDAAGAALGAALDAAALLDIDPGRSEAMMVVATGVCAEFDRLARPMDDEEMACEKSTSQKATPGVSPTQGCVQCGALADPFGDLCPPCAELQDEEYDFEAADAASAAAETAAEDEVDARIRASYAEANTEEYNVVDEFAESELADVTDEAIAEAAATLARLEAAEAALNAIAEEHRPVEAWTRRRELGFNDLIEYQAKCCVSCRDANGQPVPSPCRTLQKLNAFWEAN